MPVVQKNNVKNINQSIEKELKRMISFLPFGTNSEFMESYAYLRAFMRGLEFFKNIDDSSVSWTHTYFLVLWIIKGKHYSVKINY